MKKCQGKDIYLMSAHVNSDKKYELCQKKAATKIFMNCRSCTLNFTEEPECKNAHGEANQ